MCAWGSSPSKRVALRHVFLVTSSGISHVLGETTAVEVAFRKSHAENREGGLHPPGWVAGRRLGEPREPDVEIVDPSWVNTQQQVEDSGGELIEVERPKSAFDYHKHLFPPVWWDAATIAICAVALIIAAGGGIGGGAVLVPLYILFLSFKPKHAVALSNFTIFGGAIANMCFNARKTFPDGRPYIDWNIIVMMEPSTIAGTVVGSFIAKVLPDLGLAVLLVILLSASGYRTLMRGVNLFNKESEQNREIMKETELSQFHSVAQSPTSPLEQLRECERANKFPTPWGKVALLTLCFIGCLIVTVLKGSESHGSPIGVHCGTWVFWVLSASTIPWVLMFGAYFRHQLISEAQERIGDTELTENTDAEQRVAICHDSVKNQGKWNNSPRAAGGDDSVVLVAPEVLKDQDEDYAHDVFVWDSWTTIKFPLICTFAGLFAGLFGVGGGIVKGPLMLEMGVNPLVSAATAATMILFTSSATCVSFYIFGNLEPTYGIMCFLLGLVCTAVGQAGINAWMKKAHRQSPPVLSIAFIMLFATALVLYQCILSVREEPLADLLRFSPLCA
mmetsp:Transcript_43612/g.115189  ORF Transcript_43612/g.115189 Transcript_43612/m.115189 type:complete len:561 (-) Transcript_43612:270-1952(-)